MALARGVDTSGELRYARASAGTALVAGRVVEQGVRCTGCGRRLAQYATPPYSIRCYRCKADVKSAPR